MFPFCKLFKVHYNTCQGSVEGDLANANSAQTVLYFFLLMLYKTSTYKIFWQCAVVFFHKFYSFLIGQFLYSQCFQVLRYLLNIFKWNNALYMPRVVLFILKILLFNTNDLNSIKMMWNHTKPETLPPIIRRVYKIFWQCAVVFFHKFYSFLIGQFLFLSFYQFASRTHPWQVLFWTLKNTITTVSFFYIHWIGIGQSHLQGPGGSMS
jgi:hypothetical protein